MILFFDTETTGLPKNWKAPVTDLDNWPRLVQLAYLVYDYDGNLIHSCNQIIRPEGFTIPLESSNVHGITTEIAYQRGSYISDVLELFQIHLTRAKLLVAHNMAFDEKIIGSELLRKGLPNVIEQKDKICTMLETIELCKIQGPYGYKWPKLEELHRHLFNVDFEGAHDAMADIEATAKCFWELLSKNKIKVTIPDVQNKTKEHWATKFFTPWQITLNNQEEIQNFKNAEYFFFRKSSNLYQIHKQSGSTSQISLENDFVSIDKFALTSNRKILLNGNLIFVETRGVKFEYKCLAEDIYFDLQKIEFVNETDTLISYQGQGDHGYIENGIIIYNFNLQRIIYYRALRSEYYIGIGGFKIQPNTNINDKPSIAKITFNAWHLNGLNIISIFSICKNSKWSKDVYLNISSVLSKPNVDENSKLFEIEKDSSFEVSFQTDINFIFLITPKVIWVYNLLTHSLDSIDFSKYGVFTGVYSFKKPYLYLSVFTNTTKTLLVYDVLSVKEIKWYKNGILSNWKIHDYYNAIIYQTENLKGFICDRFSGEILLEYETYNSLLFDISIANRISRRKEFNPTFTLKKSPYIFLMETEFFMSKDRIFLMKINQDNKELSSHLLEDLVYEKNQVDDYNDDLPF
jgi:DNA polymerase-3 subunit epsilon